MFHRLLLDSAKAFNSYHVNLTPLPIVLKFHVY